MNSNSKLRVSPGMIDAILAAVIGGSTEPKKSLADQFLAEYSPVAVEDRPQDLEYFRDMQSRVAALDPSKVDSFIVLVLNKAKDSEPCRGYGELHEYSDMDSVVLGDSAVLGAMLSHSTDILVQHVEAEEAEIGPGLSFKEMIERAKQPGTYGTMTLEQIFGSRRRDELKGMNVTQMFESFKRDTGKEPTEMVEHAIRHLTGQPKEGPTEIYA